MLKDHVQNLAEKLVPDPFLKNKKSSISLGQESEILYSFLQVQVEGHQTILKIKCKRLALASYKVFLKNKVCGTSSTT